MVLNWVWAAVAVTTIIATAVGEAAPIIATAIIITTKATAVEMAAGDGEECVLMNV